MAKSGKHKKIRKQEKAKVQLKGKALLKAQNVIVPKLQSKKIFLREQLKGIEEGEASTRRKQNIFDVLTSLNHHNTNQKLDALSGLHELITTENTVLDNHLGRIVEKIAMLTSDAEHSVRKENMRIAETLLCYVTEDQLQPFWNLLLTHLKCTLTNLLPSIRQHCLSFITLLIEQCPNLVATSKDTILPAVMNLISTSTSSATSASGSKTRLKLDISDSSTEIKERIRVLTLIASCLDLETESTSANHDTNPNINMITRDFFQPDTSEGNTSSNLGQLMEYNTNEDNSDSNGNIQNSNYLELYYPFGYEYETHRKHAIMSSSLDFNVSSPGHALGWGGGQQDGEGASNGIPNGNSSGSGFIDSTFKGFLYRFIHSCFPVLCETWVEVAPSNKLLKAKKTERNSAKKCQDELEENQSQSNLNHLNKNAVEVLQCIVDVMVRLIFHRSRHENLFDSSDSTTSHDGGRTSKDSKDKFIGQLRKFFGQDLKKYFFSSLPFSCVHENQRGNIVTINAQLFRVAAMLKVVDRPLMDKFEKYVKGMMANGFMEDEHVPLILETARMLVLPVARIGTLSTRFIERALQIDCQRVVYSFLEDNLSLTAGMEEKRFTATIHWSDLMPHFLKDLPSQDMELHTELISILTLVAVQNLVDLRPILKENLVHFIEKLKMKKRTTPRISQDYQDVVIRLFYYANSLDILEEIEVLGNEKELVNLKNAIRVLAA